MEYRGLSQYILTSIFEIPNQVGNDVCLKLYASKKLTLRHPQLDWGSHVFNLIHQIPNQVGNDARLKLYASKKLTLRHPQLDWGSHVYLSYSSDSQSSWE